MKVFKEELDNRRIIKRNHKNNSWISFLIKLLLVFLLLYTISRTGTAKLNKFKNIFYKSQDQGNSNETS